MDNPVAKMLFSVRLFFRRFHGRFAVVVPLVILLFGIVVSLVVFAVNKDIRQRASTGVHTPIGWIDVVHEDGWVSGWAVDLDVPSESIEVAFYLDGSNETGIFLGKKKANDPREDVNAVTGATGKHAYTYLLPDFVFDQKEHTLTAYGIDGSGNEATLLLPNEGKKINLKYKNQPSGNSEPTGWIDVIHEDGWVSGWAVDHDKPSESLTIEFYLDGPAGVGSFLGSVESGIQRNDVNEALKISGKHGYTFQFPESVLDGNEHTLFVHGVDRTGNVNQLLLPKNGMKFRFESRTSGEEVATSIEPSSTPTPTPEVCELIKEKNSANEAPVGKILDITKDGVLYGWIVDPDDLTKTVVSDIYVDGPAGSGRGLPFHPVANLSMTSLPECLKNHVFLYQLPTKEFMDDQTHTLYMYARDTAGGELGMVEEFGKPFQIEKISLTYNGEYNWMDPTYHAQLVVANKRDYTIAVDGRTGTIYKYYNNRSAKRVNMIDPDPGSAFQLAVHTGELNSITKDGCANQGYWNPTQAGAYCSSPNDTTLHRAPYFLEHDLYCDGKKDNACTTAKTQISQSMFRMMNFDYGPSYEGPYNDGDQLYLSQDIDLKDSYAIINQTFVNKGESRPLNLLAWFLCGNPQYDTVEYINCAGELERTFAAQAQTIPLDACDNVMTLSIGSDPSSAVTIGWTVDAALASDQLAMVTNKVEKIRTTVVMPTYPSKLEVNKPYSSRFVMIPYGLTEKIPYEKDLTARGLAKKLLFPKTEYPVLFSKLSWGKNYTNYGPSHLTFAPQKFTFTRTDSSAKFQLKSNTSYKKGDMLGRAIFKTGLTSDDRPIHGIRFTVESNMNASDMTFHMDVPGAPYLYTFDESGYQTKREVVLEEVRLSQWIAFYLLADRDFTTTDSESSFVELSDLRLVFFE
ncbi:MAG: hypothetical protein A2378_02790 [Candidatus Pacebacteria bacterium RIFOXYB1_FULL_44_10]|nr:MAG: hypothetical protein A2378_02790 [Candidatus Pacebacteria bacterium RIFOXYB1_FULL_44_10]